MLRTKEMLLGLFALFLTFSYSSASICLYGGYCSSTADCVAGTSCVIFSAYYSQCLPDLNYLPQTCIADYSQCGGGKVVNYALTEEIVNLSPYLMYVHM